MFMICRFKEKQRNAQKMLEKLNKFKSGFLVGLKLLAKRRGSFYYRFPEVGKSSLVSLF
jgi:hypothetical protein